jgi:hypothetical protein
MEVGGKRREEGEGRAIEEGGRREGGGIERGSEGGME